MRDRNSPSTYPGCTRTSVETSLTNDGIPDFGIAAQALQCFAQRLQHCRGERVEPFGAVERQPDDPVFPGFQQVSQSGVPSWKISRTARELL